jgi:hypothetical protein
MSSFLLGDRAGNNGHGSSVHSATLPDREEKKLILLEALLPTNFSHSFAQPLPEEED